MAEQKVKLTELPTATDTLDTAQLLVNQNSTDQKLAITHLLRAKNNLSELEDFAQARANLDVPSVEEVNNKLSGFIDGSYTFIAGGSLASRSDFIWDEDTKSWYYWSGVLPKEVPAASNPDSTGGTGVGAWIPVGESVLRGDLAKPTGSSLIGYQHSASGSIARTVQDKLDDFVSVLDFGAKGDGVTDDSIAFKKASATGKKVFIPDVSGNGSGCIYKVKNVYIKKPLLFGENIGVEIQPVSAGDEMFYFGDPDQPSTYIINGARIENLTFSCPSALEGAYPIAIRCHQQQQMEVFGCTFYRLTFELIDYRYVTFRKIRGIGSMFYSNRTQPNGVDWADALVISDSFIAYTSRIEVRNSVGFQMRNTYCANPTSTPCLLLGYDDWAKPSHGTCELTDVTIEGVTELNNCNLFVFIVNGHMGAFQGHGLTLRDCFSVNCANTEFHYSRDFGVYMDACKKSSFTNTRFTNNGEGGIRIGGDTQYVAFAGCLFGEGGIANDGPTQMRGINIEDTSGGVTVLSSVFDGNSEVNIGGDQSKYRVLACQGVPDTVIVSGGGTSQRPSSPKAGQQYYDTSLGLPVWWNATTETWQRADGTNT
ncbi:right-handed parallel beta-helix repeat-containing protein [Enterobacter hormaechei subsp. hoffmannii]|nr:right-handed parallel beta-helix repeat-containing protein [Enterobacter hormaechei subsp. hoffmannii]MCU4106481.1 right-handed parallel beta-helix repeat-containing protein [Enterobacter hormaechei subsp. hoffmannii]